MKQIISINIGQAGVQVANSCWELFSRQHGMNPDGRILYPELYDNYYNKNTLFVETSSGKYLPRALLLDLQPTAIDQIRTGTQGNLFHPEFLISGKQDASSNFARGISAIGKDFIQLALDKIRKITDNCNNFQGFMITNSVGGGTGSGLGSLLLQRLSLDYDKKTRMNFAIYPSSKISTATVEPYNAVLASNALLEHSDVCVMLDNEAIYDICRTKLNVERPAYINLNRLIAQVYSSITSSFRYECPMNGNMSELVTNLIPFQTFNFVLSSYSPLLQAQRMCFEGYSVEQLTYRMFDPQNMMVKCDPRFGKYMACCLMYMGDVVPRDINQAIRKIRDLRTIQFADWCPTGFKVAINHKLPIAVPGGDLIRTIRASLMIANTTAIKSVFQNLAYKFDRMYAKRAFVHWYLQEGMEQARFQESRERFSLLQKDYEEAQMETSDIEQEDKKLKQNKL